MPDSLPQQHATASRAAPVERASGAGLSARAPELLSFGLVGVTLGVALIVGVNYIGNNASARTTNSADFTEVIAPIPVLQGKGDLLVSSAGPEAARGESFAAGLERGYTQVVARAGKGDMILRPVLDPPAQDARNPGRRLAGRILSSPPVWKLEKSWRMARLERARVLAQRRKRLRELSCLAKAVYFEARSESLKGQMAVAKVVLNRVRDPRFPNTVCGVVYQGAERRNACQFSFACDGKSDYPANAKHWRLAQRIAAKALRGQIRLRGMEGVAFYHADYVRPTWASMMRPVVKIGRHIFYRDS